MMSVAEKEEVMKNNKKKRKRKKNLYQELDYEDIYDGDVCYLCLPGIKGTSPP